MSIEAVKWALGVHVGNADEKHTLTVLANHHNAKTGKCFPSQKTLADESERSVDTIQRHLKSLKQKGLIDRERRYIDGYRSSDGYTLAIDGNLKPQDCGVSSEELKPQVCGVSAADLTPQNEKLTPQNPDLTPQNTPLSYRTVAVYKDEREEREDIEREDIEHTAPAALNARELADLKARAKRLGYTLKQRGKEYSLTSHDGIVGYDGKDLESINALLDMINADAVEADAILADNGTADATALVQQADDVIVAEIVDPIDAEFDERFWPVYPKKVGRLDAKKAFVKARKAGTTLERIMSGLQTYIRTKESWRGWKDPAAWLNGERWNDEPPMRSRGNVVEAADQLVAAFANGADLPERPF